jgi:hypothetical protein
MEPRNTKIPTEESRGEQFVDERTRDKIHNHISDPNSKITEQDIANVNTDIFKRPDEELTDEALMGDHPATESPEEPAPKAPNAWDILEDE